MNYAMTRNTHHVRLGQRVFAVSTEQRFLLCRARSAGGALHVIGGQVRTARTLQSLGFGILRDDGGSDLRDGERWTFTLSPLALSEMGDVR